MRIGDCASARLCFVSGNASSISPKAETGWANSSNFLPAAAPSRARARALFAAGILTVEQGDYVQAEVLIGESRDVSRELGDKQGVAVSLNALAVSRTRSWRSRAGKRAVSGKSRVVA